MHPSHQILTDLADLGLDLSNHTALLMLPLVHVAWADGDVDPAERSAILAFGVNNRIIDSAGVQLVEQWLTSYPGGDYIKQGLDVLVRLAWHGDHMADDISVDKLQSAIDYCEVVGQTAKGLLNGDSMPKADRQAVERVEVEVARLHAEHGPADGVVGRPLTPDWAELLHDLRTGTTNTFVGRSHAG